MTGTSPRNILEFRSVTRRYADSAAPAVLRGLSFSLDAGESLAVVGPSGCGKSTLLNLAGGLDRPSSGEVLVDGRDLAALGEDELAAVRNQLVGFIFQLHHLLAQCTVLENVLIPTLALRRRAGDDACRRARELLDRVGLGDRADDRPGRLSGGERQRVAVVRALINRPRLLLADEPTGSLDRASADALGELLGELNRDEGVALLVVTHSMRLAGRMQRIRRLDDGTLSEADDLREVLE